MAAECKSGTGANADAVKFRGIKSA